MLRKLLTFGYFWLPLVTFGYLWLSVVIFTFLYLSLPYFTFFTFPYLSLQCLNVNGPYSAYNFLKMAQCEHNISVLFPVKHCVLIRRQQQQLWISCMKHFKKKKLYFI